MPDDALHSVLGHQLQLLQLRDAPLLFHRERGAPLQRLELTVEPLVLGAKAAKLLVLGRESFDEALLIHARPPSVGSGEWKTNEAGVPWIAGFGKGSVNTNPRPILLVAGTCLIAPGPWGCQELRRFWSPSSRARPATS